jgi:O-acetylserine/cysteine efflux transporter
LHRNLHLHHEAYSLSTPVSSHRLSLPSILALVLVTFVWGSNFVVIKVGLTQFPALVLGALRFAIAALPMICFLPRPKTPLKWIVLGGLFTGAGQFGLLLVAMRNDISPGLASLLMQTQVFITVLLAAFIFKERVSQISLIGLFIAAIGLLVIIFHADKTVTSYGLTLTLLAASSWACGNLAVKCASRDASAPIDMVAYMAWSSLFAMPPLFALALVFDGSAAIVQSITSATWSGWASIVWQSVANTLLGYAVWNRMLSRYPAAMITPFALLIPVFGMASSALLLHESFAMWKLMATALILGGLTLNTLVPLLQRKL